MFDAKAILTVILLCSKLETYQSVIPMGTQSSLSPFRSAATLQSTVPRVRYKSSSDFDEDFHFHLQPANADQCTFHTR